LKLTKPSIAVIGASQAGDAEIVAAEEVGRLIARRGATLVCGGLGGVMEAACRGASTEGGLTVGILPGDNSLAANEYIDVPVVTGMGYARNLAVVRSARAVIAIGGSYGTLSEIAYALQAGLPVIGLGTWHISRNGRRPEGIIDAGSPVEAVDKVFELVGDAWQKK